MKQLTIFTALCCLITLGLWYLLGHLHYTGNGWGSETIAMQNACTFHNGVISCNVTETKHKTPYTLAGLFDTLVFTP